MAGTITVSMRAACVNGTLRSTFEPASLQVTQTTAGEQGGVWVVGTTEEDLGVGDVATLGLFGITNTDATNYVQFGPKSGGSMVPMIRLKAGESALMRLEPGITVTAKANGAACRVKFWLMES